MNNLCTIVQQGVTTNNEVFTGACFVTKQTELDAFYQSMRLLRSKDHIPFPNGSLILSIIGVKRTNPYKYQFSIKKSTFAENRPGELDLVIEDIPAPNLAGYNTLTAARPFALCNISPMILNISLQYIARRDGNFTGATFNYKL